VCLRACVHACRHLTASAKRSGQIIMIIIIIIIIINKRMSRDQNAGRSHSMKNDNSSIERVEEFRYLGTTLRNKNSFQEEIKSRLKLGNACYYSVQNLLSSSLLSKKLRIKICRTVLYWCETW